MNSSKLYHIISDANKHCDTAEAKAESMLKFYVPESFKEDVRSELGMAASLIERAFDVLNDVKAPPKVTPEDVMQNTSCKVEDVIETEKDADNLGISADKEAVDVIQQTIDENAKLEFGEVNEQLVDYAISDDTLERFFCQIVGDAVKGEILKYKETKGTGTDDKWEVSFVVQIPNVATRAYSVQIMKLFAHWLNEYGYAVRGSYSAIGMRSIEYVMNIKEQGYEDDATEDDSCIKDNNWTTTLKQAEQRLDGTGNIGVWAQDYHTWLSRFESEPHPYRDCSLFKGCQDDYSVSKEKDVCSSKDEYVHWFMARAWHYTEIIDSATLTILNAYNRGGGRRPTVAKVYRVTAEVVVMSRIIADKAIVYGLRTFANRMHKKTRAAFLINDMVAHNDFSVHETNIEVLKNSL